MANEKHLALFKQGTAIWNHWRIRNSLLPPDLSGAALRQADLKMIASEQYSHPYYWAAFVLSGDWRAG